MLNATVLPQFESYCPSFFLDWVNKFSRVETHGVTRVFFFLLIHKFIWMKRQRKGIFEIRLAPHVWGPNHSIHSLQNISHTQASHSSLLLRRLPLTEDVGIIPIIQSLAPFSAHVSLLQIFKAKVNPSSSHTHLGLVALAQSFLSTEILSNIVFPILDGKLRGKLDQLDLRHLLPIFHIP